MDFDTLIANSVDADTWFAQQAEQDPEFAESKRKLDLIHEYHRVKVTVVNVIRRGALANSYEQFDRVRDGRYRGWTAEFNDFTKAMEHYEAHKFEFNNCRASLEFVADYVLETRAEAAYSQSWTAPMVKRLKLDTVWEDWHTGESHQVMDPTPTPTYAQWKAGRGRPKQ